MATRPRNKNPAAFWLVRWLPLVVLLTLWQILCGSAPQRAFYFATPWKVVQTLLSDLLDGSLLGHIAVTSGEALAGFVLGNVIGTAIGLSLWFSPFVARVSKPYLVVLGAVPVFALGPMTIIWFGVGIFAKVVLAFLATVFIAAAQAFKGAEQVDPLHLQRMRIFGATRAQVFRWLLVPSSAVWVIASLRLTIGAALLGAFIGEFIAADKGLGYMILRSAGLYDTPRVIVGVISIVAIASTVDRIIDPAERFFLAWRPGSSNRAVGGMSAGRPA